MRNIWYYKLILARPDSNRESFKTGLPAGRRPPGGPISRLSRIESGRTPTAPEHNLQQQCSRFFLHTGSLTRDAMVSGWCCQRRQPASVADAAMPPRPLLVDTDRSERAINNWHRWTKKLILIGRMRGYWHDAGNQEKSSSSAPCRNQWTYFEVVIPCSIPRCRFWSWRSCDFDVIPNDFTRELPL